MTTLFDKKRKFDVMDYKWPIVIAIIALIFIILLHKEDVFGEVSCNVGHKTPELRVFYPLPTQSSNKLLTVLSNSNM